MAGSGSIRIKLSVLMADRGETLMLNTSIFLGKSQGNSQT